MTLHKPIDLPRQERRAPDDVEQAVARTADLVLKLTALAERYERGSGSPERVALMRAVARRGRSQIASLAG